ncbi:MAG: SDR family NAD(P)-dependent oxidoreductase [Sphingopyxis sp.]|nr:SDR family NAD(P)-dependent oxidoreductase [Sphingopyxis sp.]
MEQNHGAFDSSGGPELPEAAIAIVGMSCRFADARGIDEYWDLLRSGREAIRTYSDEELVAAGVSPAALRNRNYVRRGAPLEDMECFDATLFGMSPRDAAIMDPQHRHFLECTWEALENAGHTPQRFDGVIGVFAGSGHNAYMPYNLLTNARLVRDVGLFLLRHTSNDKDFLTTRVSYLFDLKGPSINVQTACSTSLVSIHMAAQSLLNGECDMAIAGGSSIELPHRQGYIHEEGEILSPDGHCRPFDAASQGTVFGSGVAVLALRRLEDAVAAGDHIYAVLRGSAINNDGAGKVGYLAPSVDGQAKVIAEALAMADVDAGSISYVEAHGTGTPVGDPIELAALTQAFRQSTDRVGHCAIGSVKANIGHTDTAAGAAGLIKVALALHNGELPASFNFDAPNPALGLEDSPFRVQSERTPWAPSPDGTPRRAGISSLGVGGTNAHVVLEEAPPRPASGPGRRRQLLLCTAKSSAALQANAAALAGFIETRPQASLPDTAFTLSIGRQHLPQRRFAVAGSGEEAVVCLRDIATQDLPQSKLVADRSTAFLFCGAGPQHADMGRGLHDTEPLFREAVDNGLAILDRIGAGEVRRWLFPNDADRAQAAAQMERPSIALPALFIIQTALARLWMSVGIQPSAMIGHSSGEYAAAHLAGVIDMEAGLRIVTTRGRLFEAVRDGGMLSVPLSEAELRPLLPPQLSIAAINAPGLCVVSGPAAAISGFRDLLAEREIEAQIVRISVAAHSPMLDPILPEFRALMQTIDLRAPTIPFASNLTGDWATAANVTDPEYWVRHLRETVRFTDGLHRLLDDQERALLEVGPGRGMASLARQHPDRAREQPVISSMRHPDQRVDDDAAWLDALGQLWAAGAEIDWDAFWQDEQRLRIPLPTYRFERQRHWYEPGAQLAKSDGAGDAADRSNDPAEWQYEPVWTRSYPEASAMPEGVALVMEDMQGLGQAITRHLREAGRDVVVVRAGDRFGRLGAGLFSVNPASQADYGRLFDMLGAEGRLPTQIYHCWLVTGAGRKQPDARRLQELGFFSLIALSRELAHQVGDEPVEIALLTDRLQRIGADGDLMPCKATATGAASVVPTEYPNLHIRCIDVALPSPRAITALAEAAVAELGAGWSDRVIAYRGGERWVRTFARVPATQARRMAPVPVLRPDSTYIVTGGLGGLGLTIARHLADCHGARIALLGRSALPPRESWTDILAGGTVDPLIEDRIRKIMALEASGATVEILVVDVGNARAMRHAIREVTAKLGPVTGVFHAAGALDDGLVETRSRAAMEAVLRPKVAGTLALEEALEGQKQKPEFIMLFSSISAFAGLPGQADYAAANAFLDAYAQSRHAMDGTRVLAVGWSPWREVGMAAALGGGNDGLADQLPEGTPVDHPFLDSLHIISPDEFVVSATLSPDRHWLLDEHRIAGAGAVIPGTGFLELARAAYSLLHSGMVVLSDVRFLTPFAVADGAERALRVHLKRRVGEDWSFAILGRPVNAITAWVEHAGGQVSAPNLLAVPDPIDIAGLEGRCTHAIGEKEESSAALRFGPRWSNVRRIAYAESEAVLRLEMDPAFQDELGRIHLHPALLDFATAGAQTLIPDYRPGSDFFAPFAYRRLVMHAPLTAAMVSHIRYRQAGAHAKAMAVFDVTIADENGRVLAEVAEFTMMRVRDSGLLPQGGNPSSTNHETTAAPIERANTILPEEGIRVIEALLRGHARPQVIISPSDIDAVLARLRAPARAPRRDIADSDSPVDLPATVMEEVIAGLWSDLLGVEPVGRNDNFFDLGGHSLLAVQFANRLRKKTGKVLPLAALLDKPTVASLAAELDPEGAAVTSDCDTVADGGKPALRDVVTIRSGGSDTPVFFVHDGLGETLLYRGLALRLDPNRPIYGIEPLRTDAGGFAHTQIRDMAANYIERIRLVQPQGPYLLAGLCAGGVIAFEIARQLQDAGDRVAFVGIIDAADVAAAKRRFHIARARLARIQALTQDEGVAKLLPALARKTVNAVRWEVESRTAKARDRRTVRRLGEASTLPAPAGERPGDAPTIPFLKLYEVAHTLHRPEGLFADGSVVLFKATGGNGEIDDMPYQEIYSDVALGWGKRVAEPVALVEVPGGHSSALQEPHVGILARHFQNALDSATERAERSGPGDAQGPDGGHDMVAAE